MDESTIPAYYYYINPETIYEPQQPNPLDDLISVYGLDDVSRQVARTNLDGSKAVKLRKSYKNQIADISGRFTTIPTRENGKGGEISSVLFNNANMGGGSDGVAVVPNALDWDLCEDVVSQFERSYPTEFQNTEGGFQIEDLAFDMEGNPPAAAGVGVGGKVNTKKRKMNSSGTRSNGSSSMATPIGGDFPEDFKRRKLDL